MSRGSDSGDRVDAPDERARQGGTRAWLRWLPGAFLGGGLALGFALLFSGGMRAVVGWLLLLGLGQLVAPLTGIAVLVHALRRRRLSAPMALALGASLVGLWPGLWTFGVLQIAFPASLDTTRPAATVRLPSNETLRVVFGGDALRTNRHAFTPDQRWAYDMVIEPALHGSARLEDYGCHGTPVVAPVSSRVRSAVDGLPDALPGAPSNDTENPLGNNVVLELETGTFLVLAHLAPGSVRVREGETVREGQVVGACGNSGNTSEPHIHIHHQRQDPTGRPVNVSEGLPLYFRDHDGPPMPEGGYEESGDSITATGAVVTHRGAAGGEGRPPRDEKSTEQ